MGRIGRSYPRFGEPQKPAEHERAPAERERVSVYQLTGAIIGILAALGLIGWLLSR